MIDRIDIPLKRLKSGIYAEVNGDAGEMLYEGELT